MRAGHAGGRNALIAPAGPLLAGLCLMLLVACSVAEAQPPEIRPVRVVTVEKQTAGEIVSLTGTVQAQTEVNLAFRIDGRMIERAVNVGDNVSAGQVIAKLDPQNESNALRSARSKSPRQKGSWSRPGTITSGKGTPGASFTTRVRYDEVTRIYRTRPSPGSTLRGPG